LKRRNEKKDEFSHSLSRKIASQTISF